MTVIVWLWALGTALATPVGFLHDGANQVRAGSLDGATSLVEVWRTPLDDWSNATAVVTDDLVCGLTEPITVWCVDRETGALKWKDTVDPVEALPEADRARARAVREKAVAAESRKLEARRAFSALRRQMRSGDPDGALAAQLSELGDDLKALDAVVVEARHLRTDLSREMIGYTSHSPVSDGEGLFAVFGPGLVGGWDLDGTRRWVSWTGPLSHHPRGYDIGWAASPVLAGGHLIVPHGPLRALDLATGAPVWTSDISYRDYGGLAAATVGSTEVVLLPTGEVVRAADGEVLARDVADRRYLAPTVDGTTVYAVGEKERNGGTIHVSASWELSETPGGGVDATLRWRTDQPNNSRVYAQPAIWQGSLLVTTADGTFFRVDTDDGAWRPLELPMPEMFSYPSPVGAGDRALALSNEGEMVLFDANGRVTEVDVGEVRASPVVVGRRIYVRTLGAIVCLEAR